MNTCALIPVFNQESTIKNVVIKTRQYIPIVVVIDDGSYDNTADEAIAGGAIILRNELNQGKGAALKKGFGYACDNNYDAVITLDGDGQHDPEDIAHLLSRIDKADIIIGSRIENSHNMPRLTLIANIILSRIISLLSQQSAHDSQSGFRLIKTSVLKHIRLITNRYEMETELLIKAHRNGFTSIEVPIKTIYYKRLPRSTIVEDTCYMIKLFCSPHLYSHL
ncbi:MAG: glycosyltransferase family 2 protein [Candidatus Omnitrophica bacterium]|nr:glycosyltransferase family 2 protein [Candidatus Omnitrophota bacterium]